MICKCINVKEDAGREIKSFVKESNSIVEFVIVLYEHDLYASFMKCFRKNNITSFQKYGKQLNGKLHLLVIDGVDRDKCYCCNKTQHIRGMASRNDLYVRLPKEDMFVPVASWYAEYLKSKMMELLYIFRRLGANSVYLKLEKQQEETTELDVGGSFAFPAIFGEMGASVGVKNNTMTHSGSVLEVDTQYDTDDTQFKPYESMQQFKDDSSIFYLGEHQDWQDIINQRIACGIKDLKFNFSIQNTVNIERSIIGKINKLGLNLSYNTGNIGNTNVSGIVKF